MAGSTPPEATDVWSSSCLPSRGPRLPGGCGRLPSGSSWPGCGPAPLGGHAPAAGVIKAATNPSARRAGGSSSPPRARAAVEAGKPRSGRSLQRSASRRGSVTGEGRRRHGLFPGHSALRRPDDTGRVHVSAGRSGAGVLVLPGGGGGSVVGGGRRVGGAHRQPRGRQAPGPPPRVRLSRRETVYVRSRLVASISWALGEWPGRRVSREPVGTKVPRG